MADIKLTVGEDIDGLVVEVEEGMHAAPHALHGPVAGEDVGVELQVPGHVVPLEQASLLLLVGVHGAEVSVSRPLSRHASSERAAETRLRGRRTEAFCGGQAAKAIRARTGRCEGDGGARLTQSPSGDAASMRTERGCARGRRNRLGSFVRSVLLLPVAPPPTPRASALFVLSSNAPRKFLLL